MNLWCAETIQFGQRLRVMILRCLNGGNPTMTNTAQRVIDAKAEKKPDPTSEGEAPVDKPRTMALKAPLRRPPSNTAHKPAFLASIQVVNWMASALTWPSIRLQGCDALIGRRKFGSTGVLFKLELVAFGYTFVGKGILSKCLDHLEHESRIYQRLDKLKGEVVPVHLGMVPLASVYLLPGGAKGMHMMMMSWGGEMAARAMLPDLRLEVQRSTRTNPLHGVAYNDEREPNLLWNRSDAASW
ncbi:hypothetical protein IF2G_11088 [Cordyceps javanica]|nr:hypothetical protein IF2G_11088 [Cordyceps javanica]